MKKKIIIAFTCILSIQTMSAQDTFKAMFYNILNFPEQTFPANRIDHLKEILLETQPDIFMVCELNSIEGANQILEMIQFYVNTNYAMTPFSENSSDDAGADQNDLQNLAFFDTTKFTYVDDFIVPTTIRDFNHYILKLNTEKQDTNEIILNLIVCHLKASSGTENQQKRLQMVEALTSYLNTLPNNSHVLLGGDLNVYRSTEPAFQELIDPTNEVTFIDPANRLGNWSTGSTFLDVFTQSTRSASGMGGATGGFDDRFDFILTSEDMQVTTENPNPDLFFVEDSYQVFGNNQNVNCFNEDINSEFCGIDGNPATPDFSEEIRNHLFQFSDHLPVTLQLEINQHFLSVPEYTTTNYYEIIGTNIVSNALNLHTNNQLLTTKKLNIFNSLGQLVHTFSLENSETHQINVSFLSDGLYYLTSPNLNVEPLKFVKVN